MESLRHALKRVSDKCPENVEALSQDYDAQDIVPLNLTRAVQLSIDIGSHSITSTTNELILVRCGTHAELFG